MKLSQEMRAFRRTLPDAAYHQRLTELNRLPNTETNAIEREVIEQELRWRKEGYPGVLSLPDARAEERQGCDGDH